MSYFDDYVADGLCCSVCGEYIDGEEPGYPRTCKNCSGDSLKSYKIERNKQRSNYAIEQFKKNNIRYVLKNSKIGHFHAFRKYDNQLFQFWSGTGKITGPIPENIKGDRRGIATLIKILVEKEK
jgi:hypothetical protein